MSASDPYSVDCVLDGSQAAKDRVSSLAVHGEKLYVGRPSGSLSIYRLPPAASTSTAALSPNASGISARSSSPHTQQAQAQAILISNHAHFHPANKPVLNLRIVPSLSLVLSLCSDGTLHFNHLSTLEPAKTPQPITTQAAKGIYTFEVQTNIVDWPKDDLQDQHAALSSPGAGRRTFRGARANINNDAGRTLPRGMSSGSLASPGRSARPMTMFVNQDKSGEASKARPNFRLVTTLVVSIRRKLLVLRWLDAEPWDYNEIALPHSPRSLTLSPSNVASSTPSSAPGPKQTTHVFMSYGTPTDFALLEIPAASDSSVFQQQTLAQGAGEKRTFLRDEGRWGKPRELNIPTYTAEHARHSGNASPQSRTDSPARDVTQGTDQPASKTGPGMALASAPSTAGLLSGLGGYIGLGSRAKIPFVRTVPRVPASKDSRSPPNDAETEVLLVRDNTAVFLSAGTGSPTRRRGLDWPLAVEDVAMLPSQHLFSAAPASGSTAPSLQIRSTKTLDVVQTIALPSVTPTQASHYTISSLLAPPSQTSSAAASNTMYAVVTPTSSSAQESAQIYKLTPRPWKLRLREMVRQRMWEGAIDLVRDGITESEIEADDSMGFTIGADVKTNLLRPLLALLSLDRFLTGCNAHARKQTAAANAAFEEAVDTWIDLDLNPAKVLSIFPEKIAGNGLSRPKREWTNIWGEELAREGFPLDDVEMASESSMQASLRAATEGSRRGSFASTAPTSAIARDRSRLTSLFGRSSRPASMVGELSSSPTTSVRRSGGPGDSAAMSRSPTRAQLEPEEGRGRGPKVAETVKGAEDGGSVPVSAAASVKDMDAATPLEEAGFEPSKASLEALGRFLADRRRIFKPILEARPRVTPVPVSSVMSLPSVPLPKMSIEELTALAKVVDTALFKTFLETKPSLVGPLCRIENWCEVTEVEELLEAKGKHSELISLYGGKAMHDRALKLLRKFAQDEDDNEEKVGPTIRYLQNLGPEHIEVILENAQWVLKQDRQRGMEIFTADAGKVSQLPRLDVVKLLSSFDPDLCAQYLEHIIHDVGEASPEIHERLATIYLDRVLSRPSSASLQKEYHDRLYDFLYDSQQYRPERILGKVPPDSLWDIRAVLLGRMGQHKGALSIYVDKIGGKEGEERAEEYCIDVFETSDDERDIFLLLLKLYLQRGDSNEENPRNLDPALRLISNHAARLDLTAVLELLPPMIPLASIRRFLVKGLQASHRTRFDRQVVAGISKERNLQLDERLNSIRGRRVLVTQGRTCPVCGKRLGVSVLAVSHRGDVLHYGCRLEVERGRRGGTA